VAIIDRVKFDGLASRDWLVYKHPSEKLVLGTQLIVSEGQAAVFVKGGQICDTFAPGTHTLGAQNLPILQGVINIPFGGKTPFTAEIFYLNTVTKLNLFWGTSDPISVIDPKYSTRLRIRAFGQVGLKLRDYSVFLRELIGAMQQSEFVSFEKLQQFFKGIIVQRIKVLIADIIVNQKISALEITPKLDEISELTHSRIKGTIERYGLDVVNFFIQSINFPDEDFDAINSVLHKRAEFDIIGDSRYLTARTLDVYEAAAGNSSGVAGAFVAGGVGLGAGVALGGQMPQVMTNTAPGGTICPVCHTNNPAGVRFCPNCGKDLQASAKMAICPFCSSEMQDGMKFCSNCGKSLEPPKCPSCGSTVAHGAKFCGKCGKEMMK